MNEEELTPHLDELKRVLDNKVDEATLIEELNTYLNTYHLDIDAAKRGIIRKHGGANIGFVTAEAVEKKVADLNGTEQNVDITAKVVFAEKKDITVRGSPKTIISGIIGDNTGTISFTNWEGEPELEKGAVYRFKNCYAKKWNDRVQINLGNRAIIERENDVKIDLPERVITSSEMKIGELRDGVGNVTITGRILTTEVRNVLSKDQEKTVYSGLIADDTGKIQYSAWKDFELKEGETICVNNAYIRSWKGIPKLNFGDRSEVKRVDDTFGDDIGKCCKKTVGEIVKNGGGMDIMLSGTIVDLRLGSGLIKRCPQCNRSVLNGECTTHGTVEPVSDIRMKLVIDDGTGSISAIFNRDCTEKLTGITLKMAVDLAKARGPEMVAKEMAEKVIMKRVMIRGNVMSDDYGPNMIVKETELETVDLTAEATKLLKEVEEAL